MVEPFLTLRSDGPIEPFLSETELISTETSFLTTLSSQDNLTTQLTTLNPFDNSSTTQIPPNNDDILIHWPFIITGLYYLVVLIVFGVIYFLYPENSVHPSRIKSHEDNQLNLKAKKDKFLLKNPIEGALKIAVIIISTLAMHAYVGLEISFGSLLPTFAVKSDLHMSKSEGSFLTSTYWATYTFLRIFSLIAIIYLSPRFLLLVNFGIIMFSNMILVPFGNSQRWALWVIQNSKFN